jgi:hypothetical protein
MSVRFGHPAVMRVAVALIALVGMLGAVLLSPQPASAATQSADITISPATQTQATGSPQTYNINVACLGTGGSECGPGSTVTIPLDTTTTPPMTDPSWTYSATTGSAGLLTAPPTVVGDNLVLTLNDAQFIGGFSGSIRLTATPPNDVTPNDTSWSMLPTLTGTNIDPTPVPTAATSTATATPQPSVTKVTADGGSVYTAGSPITYNINATCSSSTTGNLYLTSGGLVDQLPPGVTYTSSTPTGTYDSVANTITWTFPTAASTPTGCAAGSSGANAYQVTVTAPSPAPVTQPLTNVATFTGTGPDATVPAGITRSTNASVPVNIVNSPSTGPGVGYATITKTSLAPLAQQGVSGNQYVGTYPGNWLPATTSPSYSVGAAAGSFRTTVNYAQVGTYETDLIDPLPCLDTPSGNVYPSNAYNGAVCADPAFHTTIFQVSSAGFDPPTNGLGAAVGSGWQPVIVLDNGTTVDLNPTAAVGASAGSAYYAIPTADLPLVATIELPANQALMNRSLQLTVWGYTDASLAAVNSSVNQLTNTATAIPQIGSGSPLVPVNASASIFTVPDVAQLGISKTFGTLGAAPGGTTAVNIVGAVNTPVAPLVNDVVLTDLLPTGLHWADAVTTATVTLKPGGSGASVPATAAAQLLTNYQGSGRDLVRLTIPKAAFTQPGAWTITPPTNFLEVNSPTALGTYPNTDQIFLYGLGASPLNANCTTPTQTGGGTSAATFQSSNPQDLAGDGNLSEDYCQNAASLVVSGTGAAFALTKTVQGNLDSVPRGALGIGNASNGGSGTYVLTWSNVGSDTLDDAVIYDILPFPGDTGVSLGQAATPRGSQFSPTLASVGTLPGGVTVLYSQSTNPCRPQVYSNTSNPTCVNDWSATPPASLSTVAALEFVSSSSYVAGAGFSVDFTVDVPAGVVNQVAWNSAATNAADLSDPSNVPLAAEPPKVGLVAPSTPTLATDTSSPSVLAYSSVSDAVAITGTGGAPGTLAWSLLGPVAPVAGSCTAVSWTGAPVAQSGTVPVTGDGTVTAGPTTVGAIGCYSWAEALTGTSYAYSGSSAAGAAGEVVQAGPFAPALTTVADRTVTGPLQSVTDAVTVSGLPPAAPATAVAWTLYGPVVPTAGSCAGLVWSGAPVLATGSLPVTGNGILTTPSTDLTDAGCYSYGETMPGTADSNPATVLPGEPTETVAATAPGLASQASATELHPGQSVSDQVTVADTGGAPGSLAWSLTGPVPAVDDSCTDVSWSGAPVVSSGTVATAGDGPVTTGPVTVAGAGCYSWVDTLTSTVPDSFPSPSTLAAGATDEVVLVRQFDPTLATTAALSATPDGHWAMADSMVVAGTGLTANPTVAPSALHWTLVGPVPAFGGSCTGVSWLGAPIVVTGSVLVPGDGTFATPTSPLTAPGCYSYDETLAATSISDPVTSTSGTASETVLVPTPVVATPVATGGGVAASATGTVGAGNAGLVLALTGANLPTLVFGGVAALLAGLALVVSGRRRLRRLPVEGRRPPGR